MYSLLYHIYMIYEDMELKDVISFEYANRLNKAANADKELYREDRAVVIKNDMTSTTSDNCQLMQLVVVSNEDKRAGPCML